MPSEEPEKKPSVDNMTLKCSDSEEFDKKPVIADIPIKSSMEILSELFESFDAKPPVIVKKEKKESSDKKSKKSKKKHKHKDKKKKKDKRRKRSDSSSSDDSRSEIDLAEILIKQEKQDSEKKIKIEGTDLSVKLADLNKTSIKKEKKERNKDKTSKENKSDEKEHKKDKNKFEIKLKSATLESLQHAYTEEGELTASDNDGTSKETSSKKRKHKEKDKDTKPQKKSRSRTEEDSEFLSLKIEDLRNKLKKSSSSKDRRSHSHDRTTKNPRSRSHDRDHSHSRTDRDRTRERDHHRGDSSSSSRRATRTNPFYGHEDKDSYWSRDKFRSRRESERHRRTSPHYGSGIDKKKLLEIARKNAIQMMKSGSLPGALTLGPQAQEKVIAAIKAGGKSIDELTDFCKTLSKKEELGELSSNSEASDGEANERVFHHPFQLKDRPTTITMNIKNSVPLPTKTTQERTGELRLQFPVSSGQLHRKSENEWVPVPAQPVTAKKAEAPKPVPPPVVAPMDATDVYNSTQTALRAIMPPPSVPHASPENTNEVGVDIGSIVSQRLTAIRKLQENPNDVQALTEMYKSNKEMQCWAESKQQPGQFTGTTGAQILSQAELSSGYQAWAKKDQLTTANPVSGGMGMHLLQKMGWKPGEGLGKEKTGTLEPLLLEVKLDKKGLVANEEQKKKRKPGQATYNNYSIQSKHPVSLLGEFASKRKLGAPQYTVCFECGPDHKKNFLFKVTLNGVEYKPNVASPNKKEAKAAAASVCLQHFGLLPS